MNISLVPPRKTVNNSTKQVACCVDDNMLITHTTLGITVSNTTQKSYKDVDPPPLGGKFRAAKIPREVSLTSRVSFHQQFSSSIGEA